MKPEIAEYVRYRIARAEESLRAAEALLERRLLNDAVNRLYYACFYAVSALLWTEGQSSNKHTGIRSLFAQHWIKNGRLPVRSGRFYNQLFEGRQSGDYEQTVFSYDDVNAWFVEAQTFIAQVCSEIEKREQP